MSAKRVLVLGGYDRSLVNFRGALLRQLAEAGHEVCAAAPAETAGVPGQLASMGVRFIDVPLARTGLNPFADARTFFALRALFRREQPDTLLSYTIKPVIYGSLAAGSAGVPRINALITGLGAAFHTCGVKGRLLRIVAVLLYRCALRRCRKVLVQNRNIADLFVCEAIVPSEKIVVVPGSGVDVEHFVSQPLPEGPPVFLLLARMLRDKGVEEYVRAAQVVKHECPQARFLLVGDTDPNPAAIPAAQLDAWNRDGVVEWQAAVDDVRPLLAQCTAYVLPSYHEGMPRSVLEAMATGRPVITTDTIGCRDLVFATGDPNPSGVNWGSNGALVPIRNPQALAVAMLQLAKDPERCARMGREGRMLAERHFDVRKVNVQMLEAMALSAAAPADAIPASLR